MSFMSKKIKKDPNKEDKKMARKYAVAKMKDAKDDKRPFS